jgi:hypothetical protein
LKLLNLFILITRLYVTNKTENIPKTKLPIILTNIRRIDSTILYL